MKSLVLFWLTLLVASVTAGVVLYPRESESRELKELGGIWTFRTSPDDDLEIGFREMWYTKSLKETGDTIPMPVPSSFNDVTQDKALRDYVGWVWYEKEFFVPSSWSQNGQRVFIRFGSVHYEARVFLNGESVVNHTCGHLPFGTDVTERVNFGQNNRLTVAVDNRLSEETIPQGTIKYQNDSSRYPPGFKTVTYTFDFFNYAGIHRPVVLYTTPSVYIDDIAVQTSITGTDGVVTYSVTYKDSSSNSLKDITASVKVYDKSNQLVGQETGDTGSITISNANLWWPRTMSDDPAYLYTLEVSVLNGEVTDVYRLPIGIRTVSWNSTSLLINDKPVYLRGFGRHEDSNIRGKGLDYPLIIKDYNLINWIGANSYRTSHYPYAEEIMDQADQQGIMIVDECPAVELNRFDDTLLAIHLRLVRELIARDKNRPSVIMWSIANEPSSNDATSDPYFQQVADLARSLDSRPVTIAINQGVNSDHAAQHLDIVAVNTYNAWYSDCGSTEVIYIQTSNELRAWHEKHNKPIFVTEYGADTIPGLHVDPAFVFSEEYQVNLMKENFKAFDQARKEGFFVGEMIWNFADFLTVQQITRVHGNKKGIFTRDRQPKLAAHAMRTRYWQLAAELDNATLPDDLLFSHL